MKLIQMIIVSSTYLISAVLILAFIQGFVYQVFGFSIYNFLMGLCNETVESTNNKRKLRYTKCEIYRKVG